MPTTTANSVRRDSSSRGGNCAPAFSTDCSSSATTEAPARCAILACTQVASTRPPTARASTTNSALHLPISRAPGSVITPASTRPIITAATTMAMVVRTESPTLRAR